MVEQEKMNSIAFQQRTKMSFSNFKCFCRNATKSTGKLVAFSGSPGKYEEFGLSAGTM
jgi:hypothetical protein